MDECSFAVWHEYGRFDIAVHHVATGGASRRRARSPRLLDDLQLHTATLPAATLLGLLAEVRLTHGASALMAGAG